MGWSTLMALVLDHPEEERRGRNMGLMGGALIFGVSLGAPIGGWISSAFGVRAPLWTAAGLFVLIGLLSPLLLDLNPKMLQRHGVGPAPGQATGDLEEVTLNCLQCRSSVHTFAVDQPELPIAVDTVPARPRC